MISLYCERGYQLNISYISPPTLSMTIKIEAPILLYSLADWNYQVLQVEGWIQSDRENSINHNNLKRWFPADWCPVKKQLRWDSTCKTWSEFIQEFRHVQESGEPAVANLKCGQNEKDRKVLAPSCIFPRTISGIFSCFC